MLVSRQLWFVRRDWRSLQWLQCLVPLLAAFLSVGGSLAPWLIDPLGQRYSAWAIPLDTGWLPRSSLLNYGVLCCCCAFYASLVACAHCPLWKGSTYVRYICMFEHKHAVAGLLCLTPASLFLLQYLCIDVQEMTLLAQHETQRLLLVQHFGYHVAAPLVQFSPFTLDVSTLGGRVLLLINQAAPGLLLPCGAAFLLCDYTGLFKGSPASPDSRDFKKRRTYLWLVPLLFALLCLTSRGPGAVVCEYEARLDLAMGNYQSALHWLDKAVALNPALNQAAYYHRERGYALYFLYPGQQSDDSRIYLASVYRSQGNYLGAYQELLAVWQYHQTTPWVEDEMDITLTRLGEFVQPLHGPAVQRSENDDSSLPWLQLLSVVDPSNVYGQYMAGRVQCDLHNYAMCLTHMQMVLHLSPDADIQSSAYTYMAISASGQGNYATSRELLFKAVALDRDYHNNTAREELSGLH